VGVWVCVGVCFKAPKELHRNAPPQVPVVTGT